MTTSIRLALACDIEDYHFFSAVLRVPCEVELLIQSGRERTAESVGDKGGEVCLQWLRLGVSGTVTMRNSCFAKIKEEAR